MISIQQEDFDLNQQVSLLRAESGETGAMVTFTGLVRGEGAEGQVTGMILEHYPGMTESAIGVILEEARERWDLLGITVVHRVGELRPGDQIVLVATSSRHRGSAFAAAEFIMDYLKTRAPFWKKELSDSGDFWVGRRDRDQNAADRW